MNGANCRIGLEIVTRDEWGARPPTLVENMTNPVPYVVIHHSYLPPACSTGSECIAAMKWMQDLHQINNSWNDIGYSFAVGGDDRVYEGRGWSAVGAHAPSYNDKSIGVCIIGDWSDELPPAGQLATVKRLIARGVKEGKIARDYKLVGHRQVREGTECPGDRLFNDIHNWPHFTSDPTGMESTKPDVREEQEPPLWDEDNKLKKRSS
ncbi:peptidoglycan-recognition protein LB-like isoform X2 [Cylas formicarius]|uniref:peptidoglycan-recognition protein LB-like isoform X2 n=1 Tax=Cylas formicarius TaxID=197179 RepID=UPI002958B7D1|nr:peptidoglycan-recognition protein LB-like isoform X2 [Cylas formicarius]